MISMIACVDRNMGIGKDNKLLAHLPEDLQHFKEETLGRICVFGRKTFESLPIRPLPSRKGVILTRDTSYTHMKCKIVHSIDDVVEMSNHFKTYICGGENVYKQFMPLADELVVSFMNMAFDADTFFPVIDETWIPVQCQNIESKFGIDFKIIRYRRTWD